MKILSADQIREWDQYTISNEPLSSIDLMERAATACTEWIITHYPIAERFYIFCAKGNNGGDGLAIARLLLERQYKVSVFILEFGHLGTPDFQTNLARLNTMDKHDLHFIQDETHFPVIENTTVVIDALFGTGLNRKLEGVTANLVKHINDAPSAVISIDIPSGMFTDHSSKDAPVVKAHHVLSFQTYKPAFLVPENADAINDIALLDIGLHPGFVDTLDTRFEMTDLSLIHSLYKPRKKFSHKGNFGHALLVAGSFGKMGAAILAAKAGLRSGAGLVSCQVPYEGVNIIQTSAPEAMVANPGDKDLENFSAIGIGPGIGTERDSIKLVQDIFSCYQKPMVIDADGLNCMAKENSLLAKIPKGSILTPHPKEFERLFGISNNDFDRIDLAMQKSAELNCVIVLKGHHTAIADGAHHAWFNSTGNAGMATPGSGDVLTGMLTGLLAQGYSSVEAAVLGVYLHGLAGDIAVREASMEGLVAGDLVDHIGKAFQSIQQ